jgi:hypothetical protein
MDAKDRYLLVEAAGFMAMVRMVLPVDHHLHRESVELTNKIGARIAEADQEQTS